MREQLKLRLDELKKEFEVGQRQLQELDRQQAHLRETLLRISGAIQVLDEMLASSDNRMQTHQASNSGQGSDPTPMAQKSGA